MILNDKIKIDQALSKSGQLEALRDHFPVLRACKPLAVGARDELCALVDAENDAQKSAVRRLLQHHCRSVSYKKALVSGGPRYHLDGSEAGVVSEENRESARLHIEALNQQGKEKARLRRQTRKQAKELRDQKEKAKREMAVGKKKAEAPLPEVPAHRPASAPVKVIVKKRRIPVPRELR